MGLDAEGARPVPVADLSARFRREPAARGDARCRRRLRSQALRLSRRHRGGGGGEAPPALDQMDRGPARAFHQRRPGARPVLVARYRGRRRGQAPRHPRPAHSRSRRLRAAGRQHSLQFRVDDERALYAAGIVHGGHGRRHQQDAGVVGARRRLSAGRIRHGAADGPGGARAAPRPRGGAPPQSHPGGEDALHQAAQGALRRQHAVRQRRLSVPARRRCCRRRGWDDFPQRQAAARRERRYIGIGLAHGIKGTGRGPFESGPGAGVEYRPRVGVHRRRRDRAGPAHGAGADLRRRARPAGRRTSPSSPAIPAACRLGSAPSPAARP